MSATTKPKTGRTAVVKAVRIERDLWEHAQRRVVQEDLDFSKYVRRLMRADIQGRLALSN